MRDLIVLSLRLEVEDVTYFYNLKINQWTAVKNVKQLEEILNQIESRDITLQLNYCEALKC